MNKNLDFVTSDWHIGHKKVIEFDQRPFRDLEHMYEELIRRYNEVVPTDGRCYFLGDMYGRSDDIWPILNELNGKKILVLGNHDRGHKSMYECGFDFVVNGIVTYIHGQRVTMSHCPLMGVYREPTEHFKEKYRGQNWHGELKNQAFSFKDEGQFHLHGHIHSSPKTPNRSRTLGRQFDVGLPANHYRPVSFSEIESWVVKTMQKERTSSIKHMDQVPREEVEKGSSRSRVVHKTSSALIPGPVCGTKFYAGDKYSMSWRGVTCPKCLKEKQNADKNE